MRQSLHMRIVRLAAALFLAGACALGCAAGGDTEEKPEPSAQEQFCEAFREYYERSSQNSGSTDAEVISSMKAFAKQASELEMPEEMSAKARLGLATWIDLINEIDDDASQDEVSALGDGLSAKQLDQLDSYYLYSNATCLSTNSN